MGLRKLLFVAALVVGVAPSAGVWSQTPETQQAELQNVAPLGSGSRFEGYLFRDTDGNPLPFQSDEEIEKFLAEAEVVESSPLGTGITLPRKVVLQGSDFQAYAVFKDIDEKRHKVTERINGRNHFSLDWHDWHGYDVAAYILDRLLGMERVPAVVERQLGNDPGSIRIWLGNAITENERLSELKVTPPDPQRWNQQRLLMQVFDNLVANRDSNLGNLMIDHHWRAWFIDCTRCFGTTKVMYYPLEHIGYCERSMWDGLKNLDPEAVKKDLSPFLGKAQIKALLKRRDTIVQHFQDLIDERGEATIIYDVEPPTTPAPWGND